MRFRRKPLKQQRDEAIAKASDHLHMAIRELRWASYCAYDMGDKDFATALWEISDLIPAVSREVSAYLHDWAARIQPPRCIPLESVRQISDRKD